GRHRSCPPAGSAGVEGGARCRGNRSGRGPSRRPRRGSTMTRTVRATFDGQVLRPEEPLGLPPNTRVRVTVEAIEPEAAPPRSFLETARSLNLEGPPDWSARVEESLY